MVFVDQINTIGHTDNEISGGIRELSMVMPYPNMPMMPSEYTTPRSTTNEEMAVARKLFKNKKKMMTVTRSVSAIVL